MLNSDNINELSSIGLSAAAVSFTAGELASCALPEIIREVQSGQLAV